jgi:PAS domain S-box-containing protein
MASSAIRTSSWLSLPALYAAIACGWIFLTDELVEQLVPGLSQQQALQTAKGLVFVLTTSALLARVLWGERVAQERLETMLHQVTTITEQVKRAEALAQQPLDPRLLAERVCGILCEDPGVHSAWVRVKGADGALRLLSVHGATPDEADRVYRHKFQHSPLAPQVRAAFERGEPFLTTLEHLPPGSGDVAEMFGQPLGQPPMGTLLVRARRVGFFHGPWRVGVSRFALILSSALEQHRAQNQLDTFFDQVPVGIFVIDHANRLQLVNRFARNVPGSPPDFTGQPLEALLPPDEKAEVLAALETVRSSGRPLELRHRIGPTTVDSQFVPRFDAAGHLEAVVVLSRDVTEALRQEAELHELTRRSMTLRDEEQARISRDLHDDLGQRLTALKLQLRAIEHEVSNTAEAPGGLVDRVVEASVLADQTVTEVQRISQALRPASLDTLGLSAALTDEVHAFVRRAGIACELDIGEPGPIAPDVAGAVFRIGQEALTNVARHARARRVSVRLTQRDGALVLEVADDGVGLPEGPPHHSRLGLRGMQERAAAIGGALSWHRAAPTGTLVRLVVPEARR